MASHTSPSATSSQPLQQSMEPGPAHGESSIGKTSGFMKNALSGFIAARIELASIEAKEAAALAGRKLAYGIVLGISVFFCWTLLLAGLTGLVAPFADQWLEGKTSWLPGWAAVIFVLAILHAFVALICLVGLKKKPATPLFELSRKEIENDKLWLKENK